jgi:uncharacterized membrane protein
MKRSLVTAAGLGMVSGLRTFQGLAWASRALSQAKLPRHATGLERWLANDLVARALATAAGGELAVDKLPGIPDRTHAGGLAGRILAGATVGALAAGRGRQLTGAVVGAGSAVVGAYAGSFLRREASRVTFLPDVAVAMAEDAVAAALARRLVGGK